MLKDVFVNQESSRSVSNQNYRMYMDDLKKEDERKLESVKKKAKASKIKAMKLKIQMERAL